MGQVDKPTYIYERVDDDLYVREFGTLNRVKQGHLSFDIWKDICQMSKEDTNNGILIRDLLDRLLVAYHLIKK